MRLTRAGLEDLLASLAELLERYGVALDLAAGEELALVESPSRSLSFELRGLLPDAHQPPRSVLELREVWQPSEAGDLERRDYAYELLDHERGYRRAFHLHDRDRFVDRFEVVVHEHCEQTIGRAPCDHVAGHPVRDGYRAVEMLMAIWVDPVVPDCAPLPCLEEHGAASLLGNR